MLVRAVSCNRKLVVIKENVALLYHAPGRQREFNAVVLDKSYYGPYDQTTCVDWTDDSRWGTLHSTPPSTMRPVIACVH